MTTKPPVSAGPAFLLGPALGIRRGSLASYTRAPVLQLWFSSLWLKGQCRGHFVTKGRSLDSSSLHCRREAVVQPHTLQMKKPSSRAEGHVPRNRLASPRGGQDAALGKRVQHVSDVLCPRFQRALGADKGQLPV